MIEADLQRKQLRLLRAALPGYVIFRHADLITSGIPDLSVTGCGETLWLELKHANPGIKGTGLQARNLRLLHSAGGNAFYVVYDAVRRATYITRPDDVDNRVAAAVHVGEGYPNMHALLDFIRLRRDRP